MAPGLVNAPRRTQAPPATAVAWTAVLDQEWTNPFLSATRLPTYQAHQPDVALAEASATLLDRPINPYHADSHAKILAEVMVRLCLHEATRPAGLALQAQCLDAPHRPQRAGYRFPPSLRRSVFHWAAQVLLEMDRPDVLGPCFLSGPARQMLDPAQLLHRAVWAGARTTCVQLARHAAAPQGNALSDAVGLSRPDLLDLFMESPGSRGALRRNGSFALYTFLDRYTDPERNQKIQALTEIPLDRRTNAGVVRDVPTFLADRQAVLDRLWALSDPVEMVKRWLLSAGMQTQHNHAERVQRILPDVLSRLDEKQWARLVRDDDARRAIPEVLAYAQYRRLQRVLAAQARDSKEGPPSSHAGPRRPPKL